MISNNIAMKNALFKNVFLVQNRHYWGCCPYEYDRSRDLVLTFDFGLVQETNLSGGMSEYIDHVVAPEIMEKYNFETYAFFSKWYCDENDEDIFSYKGVEIGNAFRIAIWNDITYHARIVTNLLSIRKLKYENLFIGIEDEATLDILTFLDMRGQTWAVETDSKFTEYCFPVFQWMDEKIYPGGIKENLKRLIIFMLEICKTVGEKAGLLQKAKSDVFIHHYYPTAEIIESLKNDRQINVILENYTWGKNIIKEKRLPISGNSHTYKKFAEKIISKFNDEKTAGLTIEGVNISELLYSAILKRVSRLLPYCIDAVDSIENFFSKRNLRLMVSITNIGIVNRLMQNYCHKKNIPLYIIINGLLTYSFLDDAKDATWINSYGESIKKHYFAGMKNVVCLGDPRMDEYARGCEEGRPVSRKPTIVIGAAGFDNVDLNSYLAYEFDFLDGIMKACRTLKNRGREMDLAIKIRSNGYIHQYRSFLEEYYPDMLVRLFDRIPMRQVYAKADLYISIYSQTLFEASCLGIPVLYYKKDTQNLHPPFDGKSELLTACTPNELIEKIEAFYNGNTIYDSFKEKKVMEKYIGPLDGKNLERNMDFIHSIISGDIEEDKQSKSVH